MKPELAPEKIQALERYDSPMISNAIEAFKIRDHSEGYTSREIRCQFRDLQPMVGYAVTCTMDSTTPGPKPYSKLSKLLEILDAAPKPAIVVIQDVSPDPLRSCFSGDISCTVYQALGAVGLVQDGGFRDLSGIRHHAPGFQVFAPGEVVSHGNAVVVDVDVPISVGGMDVEPGDLLHGDESGVVKVPIVIADAVIEQVEKVREVEKKLFDRVNPSLPLEEIKKLILGANIAEQEL
jgi:regulator of RNase E activity RraA